jgi:hypothetical protein
MSNSILDGKSPFFLRDYHRKYHPVINGDIKVGFCFGKDETPFGDDAVKGTTLPPPKIDDSTEKTPR